MAKKEAKKAAEPEKKSAKLNKQEDKRGFFIRRGPLLISLAIMSLFIIYTIKISTSNSQVLASVQMIEAKAYDIRFQIMNQLAPHPPSPEVVIAAIDDQSIDRYGWPFPRRRRGG